MNRVCAYDTTKRQWKDLAPLNIARSLFGVTIHNNKIYVAAGVTDTGITGSTEVYDIKTNKYVLLHTVHTVYYIYVYIFNDCRCLSLLIFGWNMYSLLGCAIATLEPKRC